ncbi:MAG: 16S rRNA (guanine(527)-N(7))-methyltransferase RsmG [Planctomycetota bacterium]
MTADLETAFREVFSDTELEARPEQLARFARLAALLLDANTRLNLTRVVAPREVAERHFLEPYLLSRRVTLGPGPVLDLGTGAGFPGLPLALLAPDVQFTLIDGRAKKIAFVTHAIRALGLENARALAVRGEEHLSLCRYELVVARAVSPVGELTRCLSRVRDSFERLVLMKGVSFEREWQRDRSQVARAGFALEAVLDGELPGASRRRYVFAVLRRSAVTRRR